VNPYIQILIILVFLVLLARNLVIGLKNGVIQYGGSGDKFMHDREMSPVNYWFGVVVHFFLICVCTYALARVVLNQL